MNQHPPRQARRRGAIALAALAVGVLGFGTAAVSGTSPALAASTKVKNPLPAVTVTDVRTGKAVKLASSLTGKKPLLVWFWAPH